jgi:RNA polymerase sigma-70 factor (ECF subfamily)
VATNYCLNKIRDSKRLEFRAPEDLHAATGQRTDDRRLGARERVMALLGQVDEKTQQIAVYAYLDGMTQEEIAQVMGLSRRTVGKKLSLLAKKAGSLAKSEEVA